jgi:hypothetical protein
MLELGPAQACEMIHAFLKAEVDASRYRESVLHWLAISGYTRRELIDNANLSDARENQVRTSILRNYRGFPDKFLFTGFPADAIWRRTEIQPHELSRLRYAKYRDWLLYSDNTRKPHRLVEKMDHGEIPSQDAARFRAIQNALERGERFPELITVEGQADELILVEGHSRATAYVACHFNENVPIFLASSPSMHHWVFY